MASRGFSMSSSMPLCLHSHSSLGYLVLEAELGVFKRTGKVRYRSGY